MTTGSVAATASTEPRRVPGIGRKREETPNGLDRTRRVIEGVFGPPSDRSFTVRYRDGTKDAPPAWRARISS